MHRRIVKRYIYHPCRDSAHLEYILLYNCITNGIGWVGTQSYVSSRREQLLLISVRLDTEIEAWNYNVESEERMRKATQTNSQCLGGYVAESIMVLRWNFIWDIGVIGETQQT